MNKTYARALALALLAVQSVAAVSENADSLKVVDLNEVEVLSVRASKTTPVAYTNITKEELKGINHGLDMPYILSLTPSAVSTSDAGAGIGYTVRLVKDRGSDYSNHYIGIPVSASAQLNFGPNVYLNAGCDVQFGFFAWKAEGSQVNELTATDNFVIIPHVSLGMKF